MPSSSAKQAKFMRAIAHSPDFAKKVGVKQSVGKDFEMADKKAKKFSGGGAPRKGVGNSEWDDAGPLPPNLTPKAKTPTKPKPVKKPEVPRDQDPAWLKSVGRAENDYAKGGKTKKYAAGGMPTAKDMGSMNMAKGGSADKAGRALVKKSADTKGRAMKFAKGGSIDGIAQKGKTRCKGAK